MSLSGPQQLEPVLPQTHQGTVLLYLASSVFHFAVLKHCTKGLNQALSIPRYIFSPFYVCLFSFILFVSETSSHYVSQEGLGSMTLCFILSALGL